MTSSILNEILVIGLAIAWLLVPLHLHPSHFSDHPKYQKPLHVPIPQGRREYARAAVSPSIAPAHPFSNSRSA